MIKEIIKNKKQQLSASVDWVASRTRRFLRKLALIAGLLTALPVVTAYLTFEAIIPHAHNVYSAAKLVYGEARGESYEGQKGAFATVIVRMEDKRFPNTMHGVIYQPYNNTDKVLQYVAMGDTVHEDLSTEDGQKILRRVTGWYVMEKLGIFKAPQEARGAHSYCVREACERSSDFGRYIKTGVIGGHQFYGGEANGIKGQVTTLAPLRSIRPQPRPQSSFLPEQSGKEIDALVAIIAKP